MLTAEVVVRSYAGLRVFQRENVDHGLLPLPSLRDTGRCRMLGIHIEGAGHPSSEETRTATELKLAAVCGPIAVWHSMQRSSLHTCFEKRLGSLYYSNKVEPIYSACNQMLPYTIVRAIRVAVNSILRETPSRVTSIETAFFKLLQVLERKTDAAALRICSGYLDQYAHSPPSRGMHLPGDG